MVVAVASPLAIASIVAVSAFRLVVVSVASVASRSAVGGVASIVIALIVAALAVRLTSIVSPALALTHLATSVVRTARLALLVDVVHKHPLGAVTQALDLVTFERAVNFALRKKRLEVRQERLDGLVGQYVVPLHREVLVRHWRLAGGRSSVMRSISLNRPAFLRLDDAALLGEVVFHHLVPGSFVAACEDILEFQESLVPAPAQLVSCLEEVWESLLVKELYPKGSAVHVDFIFPGSSRKLVIFWELCGIIPWPFVAKNRLVFEDTGHLG
jgi:hypothetical protein